MIKKTNEYSKEGQEVIYTGAHGGFFEIHIKDQLDESWSDWFEGLEVEPLKNGETILSGHIVDQAALMGVLSKIYRLNLTLLSVNEIKNHIQRR
jgi:hypothetical protein